MSERTYRCDGCGADVPESSVQAGGHVVEGHHPMCDGRDYCNRLCPVQELCGPVSDTPDQKEAP